MAEKLGAGLQTLTAGSITRTSLQFIILCLFSTSIMAQDVKPEDLLKTKIPLGLEEVSKLNIVLPKPPQKPDVWVVEKRIEVHFRGKIFVHFMF